MLTAFGVEQALSGTFFDDLHLALHGAHPAQPFNEIAGYAYARRPSPAWVATDAAPYGLAEDVEFPVATGTWPPCQSLGFWRHAAPAGLLGSIALDPVSLVERGQRLVLTQGVIEGAMESELQSLNAGVAGPSLRAMREGGDAAMARLTHASLHTAAPATEENELVGTPGLEAAYADFAAGRAIRVTPALQRTMGAVVGGGAVAAGYARLPVPGWERAGDDPAAYRVTGVLDWPPPPVLPVLEWRYDGRAALFPRRDSIRWPPVAVVGFSEGATGPVVAWTSGFIAAGTAAQIATNRSYRVTELRLTLFDRSRIGGIVPPVPP